MTSDDHSALDLKIRQAHDILDEAWWQHIDKKGKQCVGIVVLFSGGGDSTVLAHMFKDRATHFGHANTTIGIEQTRQFVRDTSAAWGVPLIEKTARGKDTFRELVLDQGFPGPGHHYKMYQRLKEHQLDQIRNEVVHNGRRERVIFVAGRRASESARRTARWKSGELCEHEQGKGSVVWASPIVHWTESDMAEYRQRFDVPRNEVSDMIHMSGECLCGAFAKPDELEEIGFFFPEVKAEIEALQVEVRAAGHLEPRCVWGWGASSPLPRGGKVGMLCESCETRQLEMFPMEST